MTLSIVTDFEEFAIYDCRTEPLKNGRPEKARYKIIRYYEFEKRWGEIWSLFSKESVEKGSLEPVPNFNIQTFKYEHALIYAKGDEKLDSKLGKFKCFNCNHENSIIFNDMKELKGKFFFVVLAGKSIQPQLREKILGSNAFHSWASNHLSPQMPLRI